MTNLLTRTMADRIEFESSAGGLAVYESLLNAGEAYTKYVAAMIVALLRSVEPALAYRWEYELVRTSGPGAWADVATQLATAPTTIHAAHREQAFDAFRELTERAAPDSWQREVVECALRAYAAAAQRQVDLSRRMKLIDFFMTFAEVRNSDAHGALLAHQKDSTIEHLQRALDLLREAAFFRVPCIAVRVSASGDKILSSIAGDQIDDDSLPATDAIYFGMVEPAPTPLIRMSEDRRDLLFANGEVKSGVEFLSYSSGRRLAVVNPRVDLPTYRVLSHTAATPSVQFGQAAMTTAPGLSRSSYVERPQLQQELMDHILDERRLIVTLRGMGGAGKTSLALWANRELSNEGPYDFIFWLSARDTDLTEDGPRDVEPDVRSLSDVARQVAQTLEMNPQGDETAWLAEQLSSQELGRCLWIFDNFETFDHPEAVYEFIYGHLDRPHCALFTTRERYFTGDRTIDVGGMEPDEFASLVSREADRLGLMLVPNQIRQLHDETGGHPYLAKLMLGGMKHGQESIQIERVLADHEGLLPALFERTFRKLSDDARLGFLALSSVRSLILESVLEIGLVRSLRTRGSAAKAVRELHDYSLVTPLVAADGDVFLDVPGAARSFGERRARSDARAVEIEELKRFLQQFTPTKQTDLVHGGSRAVQGLVSAFRRELVANPTPEQGTLSLIKAVGQKYPGILAGAAELLEERERWREAEDLAEIYCSVVNDEAGWLRLARVREALEDDVGALAAWINRAEVPEISYSHISFAANKLNGWISRHRVDLDDEQIRDFDVRVARLMEERIEEATADDCARLGWVYHRMSSFKDAMRTANRGLKLDPGNTHCLNLLSASSSGRGADGRSRSDT